MGGKMDGQWHIAQSAHMLSHAENLGLLAQ